MKQILEEIFSVELGKASSKPFATTRRYTAATARADKRLSESDCFPKYFLFRLPQGEIPDRIVEELIRQWNEAPEPSVETLVEDALRLYQAEGTLAEILTSFSIFTKLVSVHQARAIIRGLYRSVRLMSRSFIFPGGSENRLVEDLILILIEEHVESSAIQLTLKEVIGRVPDLHFAVQIVSSCHGQPRRDLDRLYNHVDHNNLRTLAAQRLYDYYVRDRHDIFGELAEEEWDYVLYQWGTDWMTPGPGNRIIVQEYVLGLIDGNPPYLGQLLRHFIDRSFGQQAGKFRFDDFRQLYDPAVILGRLDQHGNLALTIAEDRQAAELFRQAYFDNQPPETGANSQGDAAG